MSDIENVKVGPDPKGLSAKVVVANGPSRILLGGTRAYARLRFARMLHGTQYDALVKESFFRLDEAIRRPWPAAKDDLLRILKTAGLTVSYDEDAARALEEYMDRILARYSRWWPTEDGGWEYDPGTIRPELLAQAERDLKYLGWDTQLFPFAFKDVCEIATKDNVLLGPTMGYGKSRASLALAEYWRWKDKSTSPTIVAALKRHLDPWREELGGVPEKEPCGLLTAMYGAGCYEDWIDGEKPRFDKPFLLISLERLWRLSEEEKAELKRLCRTSTIIVDEAYNISNRGAKSTQAVFETLQGAHHITVTGTPIKSHIGQLLPLLQWTFGGGSVALPDYPTDRAGSERRWNARFMTFAQGSDGSRKRVPYIRHIEDLHELLAPLVKRRLRSEPELVAVLGAAHIVPERIEVDLNPRHMDNYRAVVKQFQDWYLRELAKRGTPGAIPPNELLVKLGYLVWNVGSPWRMEDHSDGEFKWPSYPRQLTSLHEKALEIVREEVAQGNRVILAGRASDPLDLLGEALNVSGIPAGVIHGKIGDKRRAEVIRHCRTGDYPVLVGSLGTIAEALNLSFANRVIVTEYPWDPSQLDQLMGRITRGIQEEEPKAYWLCARGTIQEYMIQICGLKKESISAALDRTEQTQATNTIPDIAQYAASLVNVEGEEQVEAREYVLDLEEDVPLLLG